MNVLLSEAYMLRTKQSIVVLVFWNYPSFQTLQKSMKQPSEPSEPSEHFIPKKEDIKRKGFSYHHLAAIKKTKQAAESSGLSTPEYLPSN